MSYAQLHDNSDRDHIRQVENGDEDKSSLPTLSNPFRQSSDGALSEPLASNGDEETGGDSGDPFYVFRGDLYRKLEQVDESLAEYLRIVHQTDTAVNTHELKDAKKQLKRNIKSAESTLKDVHMTVQLVENDRDKFSHIDDSELYERRTLVHTSRDRLERAKQDMNSEAVKAKMLADERAKAIRRAGVDSLGATNDAERENTAFIIDSQARTSLLMQHQDETLDELDVAVTRVGHVAENIHEEIGQQNKMLNELSDDLDKAEEELGMVMGKLAKFLKTKDRWQLGTILALFATVVVLFFLVLYT